MQSIEELYKVFLEGAEISTDSRKVSPGCIFFALKGDNFNGNHYAGDALEKGAALAVVDEEARAINDKCLLADDTLKVLQKLATYHRRQLNIPVIGLTGTNGKTTTKELIHRVLAMKYSVHATPGNLNNHIGVPLSILGIRQESEIAVIEMGANHQGEISQLCSIARPTEGLITNIGKAHLEGFGSFDGVILAKSELYEYLLLNNARVHVNADDELLMELSDGMNRSTYGKDPKSAIIGKITSSLPFLEIEWDDQKIATHLYGDFHFSNIMAAISIGVSHGVDAGAVAEAIGSYTPSNNRSQLVKKSSNTIYLDAYNANPDSMLAAIRHFRQQQGSPKVLILGDMLELGRQSQEEHKRILEEIQDSFDDVLLVGPEFMKASSGSDFKSFPYWKEAAEWLKKTPLQNAHVLIKGSRGITMEKIIEYL